MLHTTWEDKQIPLLIKSQRGVFEFRLRSYGYLNKTSIVSDA